MAGLQDGRRGDRLPVALLAWTLPLAALLLVPPFLHRTFGPPVWFTWQEAVDLFTPIVAIPLAWLVLDLTGRLDRRALVAFLLIAVVWIEGQAIHLAANAIGDAFPEGLLRDAFYATEPGDLDLWLDEVLSHWLWHGAYVALALLMFVLGRAVEPSRGQAAGAIAGVAGFVYGAVFFIVTVEGETLQLGIPSTLLFLGWGALELRRGPRGRAVVTFFLVAAVATLLGYGAWAAMNDGQFPSFFDVFHLG